MDKGIYLIARPVWALPLAGGAAPGRLQPSLITGGVKALKINGDENGARIISALQRPWNWRKMQHMPKDASSRIAAKLEFDL